MHRLIDQFRPYSRYLEMDGVLDIRLYADSRGDIEDHKSALVGALEIDAASGLAHTPYVEIDEATFHGNHFDVSRRKLVWSGVQGYPMLWTPGNFAFAFVHPPFGLEGSAKEIEHAYLKICDRICPKGPKQILSWQFPEILAVAPDLKIGAQCWGVFVLTIYAEALSQITTVVGATTA